MAVKRFFGRHAAFEKSKPQGPSPGLDFFGNRESILGKTSREKFDISEENVMEHSEKYRSLLKLGGPNRRARCYERSFKKGKPHARYSQLDKLKKAIT